MMNTLFQNWTFIRGLRLLLGVIVLIQSIVSKDILMGGMSTFLIATAVFDFGCYGSSGCGTNSDKNKNTNTIEDVEFEEVVSKK
ncbi:MAG: hypothetical protein K0S44_949 [Bacteroidetes bacterium]|nr:hypothetical protein [Bacteroidota bacterium]